MSSISAIPDDQQSSSTLDFDDFRRLGVRPFECRQTVIRLAALRSSRPLAKQQLTLPTETGTLHLSRVMTSVYRLLDPRRRDDPFQRVLIGRIMPHELEVAGRTHFLDRLSELGQSSKQLHATDFEDLDQQSLLYETDLQPAWTISLNERDLVRRSSVVGRIRHRNHRSKTTRAKTRRMAFVWIASLAAALGTGGLAMQSTWTAAELLSKDHGKFGLVSKLHIPKPIDSAKRNLTAEPELTPPVPSAEALKPFETSRLETSRPSIAARSVDNLQMDRPAVVQIAPTIELNLLDAGQSAPPLDSEIQQPESVKLFEIPTDDVVAVASRKMLSQIPELSESLENDSLAQRVDRIDRFLNQQSVGSASHWVAWTAIVQHAWLVEDLQQVQQRLQAASEDYQFDLSRVLARTFIESCTLARIPETFTHLFANGLRLCDYLLVHESPDQCQKVIETLQQIVNKIGADARPDRLQDYLESIEQITRLSAAKDRWIGQADKTLATKDTGIAGRYYCLLVRDWETGLPWLVEVSDTRISRLAQQELEIRDPASKIAVANRWLEVADQHEKRVAESIRIHGMELLRESIDHVTAIQRLEIERKMDQVLELLPIDVRPSFGDPSLAPRRPAQAPAKTETETPGLTGRISIDADDVGGPYSPLPGRWRRIEWKVFC